MTVPVVFRPCPPTVPPRIWGKLSPAEQDKVLARWRARFVPRRRPVDELIPEGDRQPAAPTPQPPRVRKGPPPPNRVMDWGADLPGRVRGWVEAGLTVAQAAEDAKVAPEYLARQMRVGGFRSELNQLRRNAGSKRAMPDGELLEAARSAAEEGMLLTPASRVIGLDRRSMVRRLERSVLGREVLAMFEENRTG